eukprot:CAMPEP_0195004044 /NCGR_PEP_ID=MMETSP0326_2-20130528/3935_1 /TAXON_ID=2866 ORGANISM="Crypthecodinium cohnii, Strain Seligo" /NCGR_SAMPLE_ID=MMETSP0326_2 /ASSEMBLY_ACC=CAM_ASM_000348 /LENGTH=248 /DNA_ID=CAMNT_0040008595 /DNA_START=194 /DNA_END=938 /DNA_ORIENTATION=+
MAKLGATLLQIAGSMPWERQRIGGPCLLQPMPRPLQFLPEELLQCSSTSLELLLEPLMFRRRGKAGGPCLRLVRRLRSGGRLRLGLQSLSSGKRRGTALFWRVLALALAQALTPTMALALALALALRAEEAVRLGNFSDSNFSLQQALWVGQSLDSVFVLLITLAVGKAASDGFKGASLAAFESGWKASGSKAQRSHELEGHTRELLSLSFPKSLGCSCSWIRLFSDSANAADDDDDDGGDDCSSEGD